MSFIRLLVLSLTISLVLGQTTPCPTAAPCRCKPDAVEVWGSDDQGCSTCTCQTVSDVQANPTTLRATTGTIAATTTTAAPSTPSSCPTSQPCRCKAEATVAYGVDDNGCRYCYCMSNTDGAVDTTSQADITRGATTTAALSTAQPTPTAGCPAIRPCRCRPGVAVISTTDEQGCPSCACVADPAVPTDSPAGSTVAASTVRLTTTSAAVASSTAVATTISSCPDIRPCRCKDGAVPMRDVDSDGCPSCYCAADPNATPASTTAAPATRPVTTASVTSSPIASTTAGLTCAPFRPCRCKAGAIATMNTDNNGCPFCFCAIDPSATAAPKTTRATSTALPTRAGETTLASTPGRATDSPTEAICPSYPACRCKPGAASTTEYDANGCAYCVCVAVTTTQGPASQRDTTTAQVVCPAQQTCRCKASATLAYDTDVNGCRFCYCLSNSVDSTTTVSSTRGRVSTVATTTQPATTLAATTTSSVVCPTVRACHCKVGAVSVWANDNEGCSFCFCQGLSTPASTPAAATTTPAIVTARASSICPAVLPVCTCSGTTTRSWVQDGDGCWVCECVSSSSSQSVGSSAPAATGSTSSSGSSQNVGIVSKFYICLSFACVFVFLMMMAVPISHSLTHRLISAVAVVGSIAFAVALVGVSIYMVRRGRNPLDARTTLDLGSKSDLSWDGSL